MPPEETGWKRVARIYVDKNRDWWRALVVTAMNHRILKYTKNIFE
jgi:hypothetical protein